MNEMSPVRPPPAFEALDVGVAVHDAETGAILDINGRLEELYGYSRAELRRTDVSEYIADCAETTASDLERRFRQAAAGDPQTFEFRVERANGELMWARVSLERTTVGGVDCVLSEVREVTGDKERERRMRLLDRVFRHDLRNRMTVILGHAEYVEEELADTELAEQARTIRDTAMEVARLRDRIERIEDVAYGDIERSPTDLVGVTSDVVASHRERHPEADLSLSASAEPTVHANEGLRIALSEAVDNAVSHGEGPSDVDVRVARAPCGDAEVTVADDGPPIPEMEIRALEDEDTTGPTSHGTGVGLWVMKRCVEALNGDLDIDRNHPEGNLLRVRLPAAE